MASRTMHLAITSMLLDDLPLGDNKRLMFGAVMPDAARGKGSHFIVPAFGGAMNIYDLSAFRRTFGERLLSDGLYLGYYLHLVQDAVYRRFIYGEHHWDPEVPGCIPRLHNDYRLLNPYIVSRCGLKAEPPVPAGIEREDIFTLFPFALGEFMADFRRDFEPYSQGSVFFFTRQMAEDYIRQAVEICREELSALQKGGGHMDELAFAWKR